MPSDVVAPGVPGLPTATVAPTGSTTVGVQGDRFNDTTGVASTARQAVLFCSPQTASDKHCDSTVGVQYAQGASVNLFELWARNSRQIEISKKAGLYKLQ